MKHLAVSLMVAVLCAAGPVARKSDGQLSVRLAAAILASNSRAELESRLTKEAIQLQDYLQIPSVLFEAIATQTPRSEYWTALCRVDLWRDGAWHLEMKGAAFDALDRRPVAFIERYVKGDDCALSLLLYGFEWALQAADVQGVDCADGGRREIQEYEHAITGAEKAIFEFHPPNTEQAALRHHILVELIGPITDGWARTRASLSEQCKSESKS